MRLIKLAISIICWFRISISLARVCLFLSISKMFEFQYLLYDPRDHPIEMALFSSVSSTGVVKQCTVSIWRLIKTRFACCDLISTGTVFRPARTLRLWLLLQIRNQGYLNPAITMLLRQALFLLKLLGDEFLSSFQSRRVPGVFFFSKIAPRLNMWKWGMTSRTRMRSSSTDWLRSGRIYGEYLYGYS